MLFANVVVVGKSPANEDDKDKASSSFLTQQDSAILNFEECCWELSNNLTFPSKVPFSSTTQNNAGHNCWLLVVASSFYVSFIRMPEVPHLVFLLQSLLAYWMLSRIHVELRQLVSRLRNIEYIVHAHQQATNRRLASLEQQIYGDGDHQQYKHSLDREYLDEDDDNDEMTGNVNDRENDDTEKEEDQDPEGEENGNGGFSFSRTTKDDDEAVVGVGVLSPLEEAKLLEDVTEFLFEVVDPEHVPFGQPWLDGIFR